MHAWSAYLPRWVVLVVGVLGWLVAIDAVLAYVVALFLLTTGGPFNPYVGIVLVVLPVALAGGLLLGGWAYCRLAEGEVVAEEVPGEAAVQGL